MRLEVPLPRPGDARAWDAWIAGFVEVSEAGEGLPVEGESKIIDAQGQIRRITLKMRDSGVDHVLVVVADTPANRKAVAAASAIMADTFPISPRKAMAALAAGQHPGGSAIVFV
jgi:hypothetical protein